MGLLWKVKTGASAHVQRGRNAIAPGQALPGAEVLVPAPQPWRDKVRRHAHARPHGCGRCSDRMDALQREVHCHHAAAACSGFQGFRVVAASRHRGSGWGLGACTGRPGQRWEVGSVDGAGRCYLRMQLRDAVARGSAARCSGPVRFFNVAKLT